MKKTAALVLAAILLLACLPAQAVRPITPKPHTPVPADLDPTLIAKPVEDTQFKPVFYDPDADRDGIPDYADNNVKSNTFASTVYHTKPSESIDTSYPYTYTWDYSWFTRDPSEFNYQLCRLSSLLAGLGYHQNYLDYSYASDDLYRISNTLGSYLNLPALMQAHGMTVVEYNLNTYFDDSHLTLADIGIHTVMDVNGAYDVVMIGLRGSNGTWQEWNSNFEIGHDIDECDDDFVPFKYGVAAGWTDSLNHMGFDITANRVIDLLQSFMQQHPTASERTVFWVTGHSRGAAVANLISAKLVDSGETVYSYNFACPNNTLSQNTADYDTIFNVVNEDDLVSYLPFSSWGYRRFGHTARLDMDSDMRDEWKSMMGESYDHAETTLTNALSTMSGIASCRNDCYTYTCSCHGDGTDDDIMTANWYFTKANRENAIAKTPACLAGYYKLELEDATFYWTYHCQPPIFFMQYLACFMAGQMTTMEFADYDVADKYESAKWALATAAAMGVGHPHYCESYFIIANEVSASDFVWTD